VVTWTSLVVPGGVPNSRARMPSGTVRGRDRPQTQNEPVPTASERARSALSKRGRSSSPGAASDDCRNDETEQVPSRASGRSARCSQDRIRLARFAPAEVVEPGKARPLLPSARAPDPASEGEPRPLRRRVAGEPRGVTGRPEVCRHPGVGPSIDCPSTVDGLALVVICLGCGPGTRASSACSPAGECLRQRPGRRSPTIRRWRFSTQMFESLASGLNELRGTR
jgi:hypothetical protein